MNEQPRELNSIQQWMQSVIMHPDGIVAGISSQQSQQYIDVDPQNIEDVIQPSEKCSSIQRLQVYGHAYYARLMECLREEFPALVHAVGDDTFETFAFAYLQEHPSQSYTLSDLSKKFPQFLRETRPKTPEDNGQPSWPDFVIDLATLERTYSDVFDGPGVENKELLQPDDLKTIHPDRWPDAKLITVPCFRLLELQYPVHEYATAVRRGKEMTPPQPLPTWLAITRRDYIVRRSPVSQPQYELLQALANGQSIGEAITHAVEATEPDLDLFAQSLENWFRDWTAAGYFGKVELAD